MVGFIEPVGTSFQSASAERSELMTRIITRKTLISWRAFFAFIGREQQWRTGTHACPPKIIAKRGLYAFGCVTGSVGGSDGGTIAAGSWRGGFSPISFTLP